MSKENNGVKDVKELHSVCITDFELYGERQAYKCPICSDVIEEIGCLKNPIRIIVGEKICEDCREKLKKLIGK